MNIPFKIFLINFDPSIPVKEKIIDKIYKLNRFENNISSCRIAIESRYDSKQGKSFYSVNINLTLGNKIIITNRYLKTANKYEDIYVAVWRAFISLRQQLNNFYHYQRKFYIEDSNIQTYGCAFKLIQANNIFPFKSPNQFY